MFLHILYSIAVLFSTIAAFAAPSPTAELPKRTSETCGGLNGLDGYFDTSTKFVLSTLNNTLPNASAGGAPLFLRRAGKMGGNEVEVLSVGCSPCSQDWHWFAFLRAPRHPRQIQDFIFHWWMELSAPSETRPTMLPILSQSMQAVGMKWPFWLPPSQFKVIIFFVQS